MVKGSQYNLRYRRRRSGTTDYRKRKRLVLSGLPRLVVRPANKHITVQIVEAQATGDRVLASAHSSELKEYAWKGSGGNLPAAYLTGSLAGYRAKSKGIQTAILDVGRRPVTPGSRLFAAMSGAVDSGIEVPHGEEILPVKERVRGEHIAAYGKVLSQNADLYQKRFSSYLKHKLKPEDIPAHFDQVREKISHSFEKTA
ncbi:MAG: 50S ribosomal protein L18 [Candidatus Bathyarchaeia archaeon]|jgi:large subunit ribosomal protein L18